MPLLPLLALAVQRPAFDSAAVERRVAALLKRMTLEEKVGQLVQFSNGNATGPAGAKVDQATLVARGGMGSVLNATGARENNALQRIAVEKSRLGIPLIFGLDVIHGHRTVFPVPLGLASTWDTDLIAKTARTAAVEASADGIRWTFSPMVDIARDARWGRIMEGAGEDPWLGAKVAAAYIHGYQTDDLSDPTSLIACAKHFVAYGGAEAGRDYNSVDLSERTLRDVYLPPFHASVEAGVATFMSGFNTINGVPASADRHTLTDILRGEWGFRGFVVSDWNSIGELVPHGVAQDKKEAALKGLTAGVDMDMAANAYAANLVDLVKTGKLKIKVVDEAAARVLRVKFAMGLFEKPYTDEARAAQETLTPDALRLARTAAEESFVLLKNEGDVLPLKPTARVALIGPLADSADDMLGEWAVRGRKEDVVNLRTALAERLGDRLLYAKGTEIETESEAGFDAALDAGKSADVVVMALGESRFMSGESFSRTKLGLPGNQLKLLQAVVALGKPVVLVSFSGRPLALPWEAAHVPAMLEAWFPGVQAGPALVRTLYGDAAPSGRLTASWPRSVGQEPIYYNRLNTGRPARTDDPNQRFTSSYLDERISPLFPFGHGLTYTRFDYSAPRILTKAVRARDLASGKATIDVEATVTNVGPRPGIETAQLYLRQTGTSVARPIRELKGYERLPLAPGTSRIVRFRLTGADLLFTGLDMRRTVEPGGLTLWIAPDAHSGTGAALRIE